MTEQDLINKELAKVIEAHDSKTRFLIGLIILMIAFCVMCVIGCISTGMENNLLKDKLKQDSVANKSYRDNILPQNI